MIRLLYYFAFFVLTQCVSFSHIKTKGKVDMAPGIGFENAKAKSKGGARFQCDSSYRLHVPYNINHTFKETTFDAVRRSLDQYMTLTCLTFEWVKTVDDLPRRFDNGTGIYFRPTSYDFPYPAQMYITTKGILATELRLSETLSFNATVARSNQQIFYALGFLPEHQRPDRDSYVSISMDNVLPAFHPTFDINYSLNTEFPYDYTSVSNFYPNDCAIDSSKSTLTSKTSTEVTVNTVLSPPDVHRINDKFCQKC